MAGSAPLFGCKTTKPCDLTATVNDAVAYTDVGKEREQDAEALCRES